MKLIFLRELGEEHLFVLCRTEDGKVFACYEWIVSVILAGSLLYLIFSSFDRPSNLKLVLLGFVLIANLCYELRLKEASWRRPD